MCGKCGVCATDAGGVKDASVNFASQAATVNYDTEVVNVGQLQEIVRAVGYDLVVDVEDPHAAWEVAQQEHHKALVSRAVSALLLSLPVAVQGMFFMDWRYSARAFRLCCRYRWCAILAGRSLFMHGSSLSMDGQIWIRWWRFPAVSAFLFLRFQYLLCLNSGIPAVFMRTFITRPQI